MLRPKPGIIHEKKYCRKNRENFSYIFLFFVLKNSSFFLRYSIEYNNNNPLKTLVIDLIFNQIDW